MLTYQEAHTISDTLCGPVPTLHSTFQAKSYLCVVSDHPEGSASGTKSNVPPQATARHQTAVAKREHVDSHRLLDQDQDVEEGTDMMDQEGCFVGDETKQEGGRGKVMPPVPRQSEQN